MGLDRQHVPFAASVKMFVTSWKLNPAPGKSASSTTMVMSLDICPHAHGEPPQRQSPDLGLKKPKIENTRMEQRNFRQLWLCTRGATGMFSLRSCSSQLFRNIITCSTRRTLSGTAVPHAHTIEESNTKRVIFSGIQPTGVPHVSCFPILVHTILDMNRPARQLSRRFIKLG